jgi:hypothetical protein
LASRPLENAFMGRIVYLAGSPAAEAASFWGLCGTSELVPFPARL